MRGYNRKTTPRVKRGRVQKKNNWELTPNYYSHLQPIPVIDRQRPGQGYRHLLKQRDILEFISLLPDWDELAVGLNAIVLAPGDWDTLGWHTPGVVGICAWETKLWTVTDSGFYEDHQNLLERLDVPYARHNKSVSLRWTENTARAFLLLHIFLHELGHHHDRMTTRSRVSASRGEPYAEEYARKYTELIWDRYMKVFGLP